MRVEGEVLSWLIYCHTALDPLVLTDVWQWVSLWGSYIAPVTATLGTWMIDSLPPAVSPPSASVFLAAYSIPILSVGFHCSSRSSWTGFQTIPGQTCLSHRVYLAHRKKNLLGLCPDQPWIDGLIQPQPSLGHHHPFWLSQVWVRHRSLVLPRQKSKPTSGFTEALSRMQ